MCVLFVFKARWLQKQTVTPERQAVRALGEGLGGSMGRPGGKGSCFGMEGLEIRQQLHRPLKDQWHFGHQGPRRGLPDREDRLGKDCRWGQASR